MPHARSSDGTRIAYEVRGRDDAAAPPLVLVHGLGYARPGWGPFPEALADDHRLVLLDNRGIGDSDVPPGPYTAEQMAGDVVAVLDELSLERVHLLGTSLGGMICQEVAAAWPERVQRLVLVASTPGGARAHPMPQVTVDLLQRMPDMEPLAALRAAVENALSPASRAADPELVDRIVRMRLAVAQEPAGWQAQAAAGTTYDGVGSLGRISAPTLIVHGEDDQVLDPANADVLAELLADARVCRLPDVGHLAPWEAPRALGRLVTDFLHESSRDA